MLGGFLQEVFDSNFIKYSGFNNSCSGSYVPKIIR